jgi:hypothetical protein
MKKLKNSTIKDCVKAEFEKALLSGELKVFKLELIKELRGHDKLYDKELSKANSSIVQGVLSLTEEWLRNDPRILIIPFPMFKRDYDGWQIITEKTKIDDLMKVMAQEKYDKNIRRLYRLCNKIMLEKEAGLKRGLLDKPKIDEIQKKESEPYKELKSKWYKLL